MIEPIKNDDEYEDYLARIYALIQKDLQADSAESDELEKLANLVENYELEYYPVPKANLK